MCRQYYHLPELEFTDEQFQQMWMHHVYEEQFEVGNLSQQTNQLDMDITADDNVRAVSPTEKVC